MNLNLKPIEIDPTPETAEEQHTFRPDQSNSNKNNTENILAGLNDDNNANHNDSSSSNEAASHSSGHNDGLPTNEDLPANRSFGRVETCPDKFTNFEKAEDSMIYSPTKSILKRSGSLKDGDMSPDRKKKGVAFSSDLPATTIIQAPVNENEHEQDDDEEQKADNSNMNTRYRSKSNETGRNSLNRSRDRIENSKYDIPKNIVIRNVSVGKVQDGVAILLSEDFNVMEIPLSMLPSDVRKGNILKFSIERNIVEEESRKESIMRLQKELLHDKELFSDYNKKVEYYKNRKLDSGSPNPRPDINLQGVIDAVHDNLQDTSFLDRSEIVYNERVIVRSSKSNPQNANKNILPQSLTQQNVVRK